MTFTQLLTPIAVVAAMTVAVPAGAAQQGRGRGHATASRGGHVESHGGRVAPYYARPYYSRPYYSRPYYVFRPRVSIGFGIWAGYPVQYPYRYNPYYDSYYNPYYYSYAPPYGYAPPPPRYSGPDAYDYPSSPYPSQGYPESNPAGSRYPAQQPPPGSVGVQQGGQNAAGGVTFDITPGTAAVFVDGTYVGTAADFGPNTQPLGLAPGRHHLEARAAGYETMTFDTDVTPGQFIPYQGTLQRQGR